MVKSSVEEAESTESAFAQFLPFRYESRDPGPSWPCSKAFIPENEANVDHGSRCALHYGALQVVGARETESCGTSLLAAAKQGPPAGACDVIVHL